MDRFLRGSIILILAVVGIGFSHQVMFKKPDIVEIDPEEEVSVRKKYKRKPASIAKLENKPRQVPLKNWDVTTSEANQRNFNQRPDLPEPLDEEGGGGGGQLGWQEQDSSSYGYVPSGNSGRSFSSSSQKRSSDSSKKGNEGTGTTLANSGLGAGGGASAFPPNSPLSTGGSNSGGDSSSPPSPPVEEDLTCSADVGGGAFGNPIQVTLTCSSSATIKYCVKEGGGCCDPDFGLTYSAPVILGEESGSYCLSYRGDDGTKESLLAQQNYTINNTYPDIQISYPKRYYQTTQLAGFHFLQSNDFSKANFAIGEVNLKTHDPGPSGLNLECDEIVENYVSLPAPAPTVVFNPLDMAFIGAGNQLNVPLALDKLDYGHNFITSFVVNNNYAAPLYSCSTNRVTLEDFDLFVPEAGHGEAGTNQVREFSGSFVAYSFFEQDSAVNTTSAGNAKNADTGQELHVGSFGVFY